ELLGLVGIQLHLKAARGIKLERACFREATRESLHALFKLASALSHFIEQLFEFGRKAPAAAKMVFEIDLFLAAFAIWHGCHDLAATAADTGHFRQGALDTGLMPAQLVMHLAHYHCCALHLLELLLLLILLAFLVLLRKRGRIAGKA